ncbi:excalibur calcium-binding domain-containing protein [Cognatilysobacter tabacisoli]|uniref:excalibur calcium-binding domain-containing protein n=1 Tax=Cognatilysobacter tabacisoli TaxID=2315424 RepID=UPI000E6B4920|nr:excalibur calcium-binding domain-containing protein [Lysobacter tabacisoli]
MLSIIRGAVFGALALGASTASAHGGGLNAEGCHNDRKRGDYHCHRGSAPARSSYAASATPAASLSSTGNALRSLSDAPAVGAYRNCSHARAAGAAPVRRGEPGYGAHLDRDGDGIGCE